MHKPNADRLIAIESRDPFRHATWRWDVALELAARRKQLGPCSDPVVAAAFGFFLAIQSATTPDQQAVVAERYPDLYGAHRIFTDDGMVRAEIEARLLAREPITTIATKTGVTASIIQVFAATFYEATQADYISDGFRFEATNGRQRITPPAEGWVWRYIARVGGPHVLDLVIADYYDRPEPAYQDRHMLAQKARFFTWEFYHELRYANPSAALLREADRLFGKADVTGKQTRRQKLQQARQDFLRMVAGKSTAEPPNDQPRAPVAHKATVPAYHMPVQLAGL